MDSCNLLSCLLNVMLLLQFFKLCGNYSSSRLNDQKMNEYFYLSVAKILQRLIQRLIQIRFYHHCRGSNPNTRGFAQFILALNAFATGTG
jgi:hypothetical protein